MQYGTLFPICQGEKGKGVKMGGANWTDIRRGRQKGLSYTEIARKYHIDARTEKKYAESDTRSVYSPRECFPLRVNGTENTPDKLNGFADTSHA